MKILLPIIILVVAGCGSKGGGRDADAGDAAGEDVQTDADDASEVPDVDEEEMPPGWCTSDEHCDDSDPCTADSCDTVMNECEHDTVDADGDGYEPEEVDGVACGGNDCDDSDETIHPDAVTTCDLVDDDCTGDWADETDADDDSDGYLDEGCGGDDCDDSRDDVHPGASPVCLDLADQDCDDVTDGLMLSDVRLTDETGGSWTPRIVWTGSEFGITWDDDRSGDYDIYFMRVGADGTKIGSDVAVTATTSYCVNADLAWTGSSYVACWDDDADGDEDVFCRGIAADGTFPAAAQRITSTTYSAELPAIAWAGSQGAVVWEDYRTGWYTQVYFQRIDASGAPIGGNIMLSPDTSSSYSPSVAWSGSEFAVCYWANRVSPTQIFCTRLAPDGTIVMADTQTFDTASYSTTLHMEWSGSVYAVTWVEEVTTDNDEIYFGRMAGDGTEVGTATRLTNAADFSDRPRHVWTGSGYAVTWNDVRSGTWQVFVKWISPDASVMSPDLEVSPTTRNGYYPSLAWTGSVVGLAWDYIPVSNREIMMNLVELCE